MSASLSEAHANATIVALATPPGRGAVAVVRLSGPDAFPILDAMTDGARPSPRVASLRTLTDVHGAPIDRALVLTFPGPGSFTGEDVVEFHLHGGAAVVAGCLEACIGVGAQAAEPGAFSRRAFENGKLDLTQAEAIADLVDAESAAARAQALRQLDGELGAMYGAWRETLISAMARLEAAIDFPDEDDAPDTVDMAVAHGLSDLVAAMRAHLDDGARGERVRDGFYVALIGEPNAGKSTLLNRLLGRDAAIVTETPGTTRDVIEGRLVLGGFTVVVADTAGLRDTNDAIEAEGVRRARAAAETADLRILVLDARDPRGLVQSLDTAVSVVAPGDIVWVNKTDRTDADDDIAAPLSHVEQRLPDRGAVVSGSALTGAGVAALSEALTDTVSARLSPGATPSLTRARHRSAVENAVEAVTRALATVTTAPELAGEDLRLAAMALGRITGRVDVEDVLDVIFREFCIGK